MEGDKPKANENGVESRSTRCKNAELSLKKYVSAKKGFNFSYYHNELVLGLSSR